MDAQNPNLELPQPQTSGQPTAKNGSGNDYSLPLQHSSVVSSVDPSSSLPSSLPQQSPPTGTIDGGGGGETQPGTPASADDADLIEKEWVIKAKQIVQQTKDDPYTQNKEITKFKAEYMKKRYNRDIKLIEE